MYPGAAGFSGMKLLGAESSPAYRTHPALPAFVVNIVVSIVDFRPLPHALRSAGKSLTAAERDFDEADDEADDQVPEIFYR